MIKKTAYFPVIPATAKIQRTPLDENPVWITWVSQEITENMAFSRYDSVSSYEWQGSIRDDSMSPVEM